MRSKKAFTLVELLVVIVIIAVLLSVLVPAMNKVRESARRVVCATRQRQIGMLLEYYCLDNKGNYFPVYSDNYPHGSSAWREYPPVRGFLNLLPYVFKLKDGSDIYAMICNIKDQEGMERMNIFWCPSGALQYDPFGWTATAFATFGYNQYCSRLNSEYEHSPLKNITHISKGEKSNTGWITVADISIRAFDVGVIDPRDGKGRSWQSNHHAFYTRFQGGRRGRMYGAAGANVLHVGGNVTWYNNKIMNDETNTTRLLTTDYLGATGDRKNKWIYPRTD